jgi:hypothetical protein
MRPLKVAMKQFQWLNEDSLGRTPTQRNQGQRGSDFVLPYRAQNILLVGAERRDEFEDALTLVCQGHSVTVVNPRVTLAAKRFKGDGGRFIRTRIEELPPTCGCFEVICENYAYPSGQQYVPPRAFASGRLSRLAPSGRWIPFTEAAKFATLLKAVADYDNAVQGRFRTALCSVPPSEAPPSAYPRVSSRFRLIFERCR